METFYTPSVVLHEVNLLPFLIHQVDVYPGHLLYRAYFPFSFHSLFSAYFQTTLSFLCFCQSLHRLFLPFSPPHLNGCLFISYSLHVILFFIFLCYISSTLYFPPPFTIGFCSLHYRILTCFLPLPLHVVLGPDIYHHIPT